MSLTDDITQTKTPMIKKDITSGELRKLGVLDSFINRIRNNNIKNKPALESKSKLRSSERWQIEKSPQNSKKSWKKKEIENAKRTYSTFLKSAVNFEKENEQT